MAEMAYVRRSLKSADETVESISELAEASGWAVLAVHDLRHRFCANGFGWDDALVIVEICKSAYASAMVAADPRLALQLPCPVVVREDADGVEVSVLQPEFVDTLYSVDFGDAPALAQAEVSEIIDKAVR